MGSPMSSFNAFKQIAEKCLFEHYGFTVFWSHFEANCSLELKGDLKKLGFSVSFRGKQLTESKWGRLMSSFNAFKQIAEKCLFEHYDFTVFWSHFEANCSLELKGDLKKLGFSVSFRGKQLTESKWGRLMSSFNAYKQLAEKCLFEHYDFTVFWSHFEANCSLELKGDLKKLGFSVSFRGKQLTESKWGRLMSSFNAYKQIAEKCLFEHYDFTVFWSHFEANCSWN